MEQNTNNQQNKLGKIIKIIIFIILGIVVLFIGIFALTSATSDKLVCKSKEGEITIMYNSKTINGYLAKDMGYNLDEQKKYAEQIGTEAYIKEFTTWFENNTSGTCEVK